MIQNEALLGETPDQFNRRRKLARVDQNVVSELKTSERFHSAQKIWPKHEIVIGFVLHDMPDADELPVIREFSQRLLDPVREQIDPANDSLDDRPLVGQLEEPA